MMHRPLHSAFFWLLLAVCPMTAGLFRVWVHQDVIRLAYELTAAEHERQQLRHTMAQLAVELAAERSPVRLEQLAADLKLTAAAPEQLLGGLKSAGLAKVASLPGRVNGRP